MSEINSKSGLDHIHQINCDLKPRCRSNAWHLQPPEQSPLVSFILDVPLPEQEPAIGPVLLQTLMGDKENNWELLIPGPEPTGLIAGGTGSVVHCEYSRTKQAALCKKTAT